MRLSKDGWKGRVVKGYAKDGMLVNHIMCRVLDRACSHGGRESGGGRGSIECASVCKYLCGVLHEFMKYLGAAAVNMSC